MQVAALDLVGVGDVVWDIEVVNGAATAQVVWQRRLSSSRYGDGAGSASVVGVCDADPAADLNTVRLWVVGVYDAAVSSPGAFNGGATTGPGAVVGQPLPFQNPTASAPLTREVRCAANADAQVRFEVALMRPAQQGFFDIAVGFNNIFCSAKFDCCAAPAGPTCALDGSEDTTLLHDANGQRASTMVLGFACTAGVGGGVETNLYLDALELDCTSPTAGDFSADIVLDPSGAPGNQCTAGADGMSDCGGAVTEVRSPPFDADTYLYQVAVYRGIEQLLSGGVSAQKVYWNVALGVKRPGIAQCWLKTRGTADDVLGTGVVDQGTVDAGVVYPFVQWEVRLGACGPEQLSFGDPAGQVRTMYTATDGDDVAFAYGFGANMPAGSFCSPPCDNGGHCVGAACVCPPAFTGATCGDAAAGCGLSPVPCPGGQFCTVAGVCVPDGTTPSETPVGFAPSTLQLPVNGSATLAASAGDPPYSYALVSGGGTLVGATYTAPGTPGSATVRVIDAFGGAADLAITVYAALSLSPSTLTLQTSATQVFTASGGVGPYTYSVVSGGGSFSGVTYTAPATAGGVTVRVTDGLGNTSDAAVTVSTPLALTPAVSWVEPGEVVTLSGVGGAGGYSYAVQRGGGGLAGAELTAPGAGTVVVAVTDAVGATATATLKVRGFPRVSVNGLLEASNSPRGQSSCAVSADRTLWCWGENEAGLAGAAVTVDQFDPVQIGSDSDWTMVSVGYRYACGLRVDGTAWCWGSDYYGQLGEGVIGDQTAPVQVGADADWAEIAAGTDHTCGLRTDGTLWCWGANTAGQLGLGHKTYTPGLAQVGAETTWRAVTAGVSTCGIKADDSLWCWGSNSVWQLGIGAVSGDQPSPVRVGGATSAWSSVSSPIWHTCGTKTDGTLWCWGYNRHGEAGVGTTSAQQAPGQVSPGVTSWLSVAVGGGANAATTCATRTDGTLWCWGADDSGQLADGSVSALDAAAATTPQQAGALTGWASVDVAAQHACAARDDGTLWCWGRNTNGALGSGGPLNKLAPWPIPGSWASIRRAPGTGSHACGLATSGAASCWGLNNNGQLGTAASSGYFGNPASPVIGGPATWTAVATGGSHSCGLGSGGTLWCWGYNNKGQLGDGTQVARAAPGQLAGAWTAVAGGRDFTCGRQADGTLWCWGDNGNKQLGLGAAAASQVLTPTQVGGATDWAAIAPSQYHACATRSDGTLWCWGYVFGGGIGDGTANTRDAPTQVGATNSWSTVTTGWAHSCAIDAAGALWCWGTNDYAQLGLGNTATPKLSPTRVGVASDWTAVAGAFQATCGIRAPGTLWCWGRNQYGEVGVGTQTQQTSPVQVGSDADWVDIAAGTSGVCGRRSGGGTWCWGTDVTGQTTGYGEKRPFASEVSGL
ncbi:MAG: hypothetical protein CVU56_01930 [Deltaproteobacteria bacterium HGW-Deltaproteobacteria-14]|nr:MAG: hypothetical protein CVU56_01930 [Deltaproteobacteria bacterium HGW-Deltaproteobacteria-14]